jgi:hypothetical protein
MLGHLDIVGAGAEEVEVLVLEDTDARSDERDELLGAFAVEPVLAHAEESEIVLGKPGEELLGFRDGG